MSLWYPHSGMEWSRYLQANYIIKGVTGEVTKSSKALQSTISEQTRQIVASNNDLARDFGKNFEAIKSTLDWGMNKLVSELDDVHSSIEYLNADFNYSMGLLLESISIQSKVLGCILDKLDAIHKTLESPLLTQAREYYRIGCERLSKGLLVKALEAFLEAEKKNDTDFFIQNRIGMIYLYGTNADDNVVDIEKAKEHLLLAARYAKAEMNVDPHFSRLAAEVYLHASIANYALIGEKTKSKDSSITPQLLEEAEEYAENAINFNPELHEARYHIAKYQSLLAKDQDAMTNLRTVIESDRNYTLKVDIDPAFNSIRNEIFSLLELLRQKKQQEAKTKILEAEKAIERSDSWHTSESNLYSVSYSECKQKLNLAKKRYESETYFGFLDSLPLALAALSSADVLVGQRREELKDKVESILSSISPSYKDESTEADKLYEKAEALIQESKKHLANSSFSSYQTALSLAEQAKKEESEAHNLGQQAYRERQDREEQLRKQREISEYRNKKSGELAIAYAFRGFIFGLIGGYLVAVNGAGWNGFVSGILGGTFGGALFGYLAGQSKTPP